MARRFALLRILIGFTLVVQTMIGPATPIGAQPAPQVTFTCGTGATPSPCSVPVGGQIVANGMNFPADQCRAEATISISLVNVTGAAPIALGDTFFSNCLDFGSFRFPPDAGTFTLPTSGSGAVPPGTYNVRAFVHSTTPAIAFTVDSRDLLTVTAATGTNTLSGTAACMIPPLTTIPFARVTIFSGSVQVASTVANSDGTWSVSPTAPNATYTVRYQPTEGSLTCGVSATTDGRGNAVAPPAAQCPNPDRGNRVWNDALQIPSTSPAVLVTDAICHANESRWFRVSVLPGQRVTAEIDDPSFDLTLGLYKDIQQISDAMTAAAGQTGGLSLSDVQRFTASIPRDASAPDATSPDATSPDATSPDATSPDATSPDATSPDATSPDATSPDATSPDATSPDATSPDATSGSYSAALGSALMAFSDKPGRSPEFVRRHTWDNTGNFYIRVRGHNGTFDETHPFNLRVTVVNHNCTSDSGTPINLTTTPPSGFDLPATPRTLILTNTAAGRFPTGADTTGMLTALRAFANRSDINGLVLDLASNAGIAADYAQWDAVPQCAPAANIVANQIQTIVARFRAANPAALQYVVIAGGDRVVPFLRIVDEAGMSNEADYSPAVFDSSESQAALKTGYFLSQDLYGSFNRISVRDHDFNAFDIPVGRLVENPPEIVSMLNAYASTGGVIHPASALVTGYDFLADSSALEVSDLLASGVTVDASLIQPEGDGPTAQTAWTADGLRSRLFGSSRFGILDLNAHFSGNTLLASDAVTRVRSSEVATVTDQRFVNSLVMSMGCHSGYNIVDPDATAGTPPADWAQAFAMQGATLVGGTGYQYGNSPFVKYTEVLMTSMTRELRLFDAGTTPGPVPIGQALLNAKRSYIHGGMNGIDEKSLSELTLYGLPMLGVSLPGGRIARPAATPPVGTTPGTSGNLFTADVAPGYSLTGHDRVLSTGDGATTATYFDATYSGTSGDVQTSPGTPVLPRVLTNVASNGVVARGVVLLSANYTDLSSALGGANPFRPLVDAPATEVRAVRPAFGSSVFFPSQLVSLAEFNGQTLVENPFQFRSAVVPGGASVFGTGRRFDSMSTRVYYSNRLDASALGGPPIVYNTKLTKNPSNSNILLVDVTVGGLSTEGIETVFATFTSEPTDGPNTLYGHWNSLPLTLTSTRDNGIGLIRHYTGSIDTTGTGTSVPSLRLFVQAVSGTGLVSLATNNGAYYQFVRETATLPNPKATTAIAFTQSGGFTATYRYPLSVAAILTNAVTNQPLAGQPVTFTLGRGSTSATTDVGGRASATLPVLVAPDSPPAQVTVGFAEDPNFLASGDRRDVVINRAPTFFVATPASVQYGDAADVATLFVQLPSSNRPLREIGVRIVLPDGRTLDTSTDGFGKVLFDTLDFGGVQPGTYSGTVVTFAGNDRYAPALPLVLTQTVTGGVNHSVAFNGTNGYAEAPDAPDVNLTGDWTVELWFKDQNPKGFNHDYVTLINKGDRSDNAESPYFITLGFKQLLVGQRRDSTDYAVSYDLWAAGVNPKQWHHLAVTFTARTRTLVLYLDGVQVAQDVLGASSIGNTAPVEIGRNGPVSGKYFRGKLDDVRLWNVARTASQIATSFAQELTSPPSTLVANWKFNERLGTLAADSSVGTHTAILSTTGAAFSTDVHP